MVTTTMTYGNYEFSPVPTIQVSRSNTQVKNMGFPVAFTFEMTLTGTLVTSNPNGIIALDVLTHALRAAFNRDGKLFEIKCGLQTILSTYPRIKSLELNESNNNWTNSVPYTIVIEYDMEDFNEDGSTKIPPFIEEYSDEWQMEFEQDTKHFDDFNGENNHTFAARVTRNISVRGKQSWAGPGVLGTPTSGVQNAMNFLNTVLANYSYQATKGHSLLGFNNLPTSNYNLFDHYRTHTINETDGTVSLVETWLVLGNDDDNKKAIEDFTITVRRTLQEPIYTVSIDGTIQGLEVRDYGTIGGGLNLPVVASDTAYANALDAWGTIKSRLLSRAQAVGTDELGVTLNVTPSSTSVGHNPPKGTINYTYEFDNRPCNLIAGALSETISINDVHPNDVFAEILILGRPQGPILQDIGTVTKSTREVIIEAVMPPPTGCSVETMLSSKPNVTGVINSFKTDLEGAYDQVFKHADTESWSPKTGRYSRTVGWTFVNC